MMVKFIIRRAAHSQVIIYCNFISITILIQQRDRDSRSKKMCVFVLLLQPDPITSFGDAFTKMI